MCFCLLPCLCGLCGRICPTTGSEPHHHLTCWVRGCLLGAWDSPSTREPWRCQTQGPKKPPRPSSHGKQLAEVPRAGGVHDAPTPSSLQSGPCTHQHPFGTFSYHGSSRLGGCGVLDPTHRLCFQHLSDHRPQELWREQRIGWEAGPGR